MESVKFYGLLLTALFIVAVGLEALGWTTKLSAILSPPLASCMAFAGGADMNDRMQIAAMAMQGMLR